MQKFVANNEKNGKSELAEEARRKVRDDHLKELLINGHLEVS